MRGVAFCPAHITGFFGVERAATPDKTGSVGAGFSAELGITTTIQEADADSIHSEMAAHVLAEFRQVTGIRTPVCIHHQMEIPAGYGLGASGALALSTLYALDMAFHADIPQERLAMMAHISEVRRSSGLGDVLAAYYGGFEIRIRAGGPGEGAVRSIDVGDPAVIIVCLSPLSTSHYLQERMGMINGIGGSMAAELGSHPDIVEFQRMSMSFANKLGTITPEMRIVSDTLEQAGYPCGVAMLGGTIFSMVSQSDASGVLDILDGYGPLLTRIDTAGARIL